MNKVHFIMLTLSFTIQHLVLHMHCMLILVFSRKLKWLVTFRSGIFYLFITYL